MKLVCLFALIATTLLAFDAEAAKVRQNKRLFRLTMGAGLVATGGSNGGGFHTSFSFRPTRTSGLNLGFETGLTVIGSSALNGRLAGGTPVMLPLFLFAYYQFPYRSVNFKPYLGGAIGPNVGLSSAGTSLAVLIRPGANIPMTEILDLNVEARFGGLDGIFVINPQFNVSLKL